MRNRRLLALLVLTGTVLACSFPGFDSATEAVPTLVVPGGGAPTFAAVLPTSTPVPLPTPSVPTVTPNAVDVNCRSGPDLAYDQVSVLPFGGTTTVAGRTADSTWWYVHDPNNPAGFCWIASSVVTIMGPTAAIPVAALPAAIANKLTVAVAAPATIGCGGPNPVTFSGTISTNGAATVQYQWEITGDKTNTTSPQTLVFMGAGTQDVTGPGAYSVDCGNYAVTLHVVSPNDLSASKTFQIAAP